jgi:anti-sigma factor RsiW
MSTATHPFAPEEIMALLDGELPADRAQSVSAHVVDCPECGTLAKELGSSEQVMSSWKVATLPSTIGERVRSAVAKMPAPSGASGPSLFQRTSLWTWKEWLTGFSAMAALGLLFLAIAIPNMRHSQMGSYDAIAISRARAPEATRAQSVDNARINLPNTRGLDAAKELRLAAPMIARSAALSLVVKDFDTSRASLDAILARHNGYAAGLNVATPQGAARTLQASLRIPARQLAGALGELKTLGRIETETQNGEEVTQQHADLVARLKNSREAEQRLQDVLRTRTGKVKEVLEVEEEIARVRGEIEQMEAEQKMLEHRVDFATIDLRIAEEYKAQLTSPAPSVGMQLRNAAINGFRTVSESLLAIVLFFAETGPTLLLWSLILFVPVRLIWRRYQRAHALSTSLGV